MSLKNFESLQTSSKPTTPPIPPPRAFSTQATGRAAASTPPASLRPLPPLITTNLCLDEGTCLENPSSIPNTTITTAVTTKDLQDTSRNSDSGKSSSCSPTLLDCSFDSGIAGVLVDSNDMQLHKRIQQCQRILLALEREREHFGVLRNRLSKISERQKKKLLDAEYLCNVCCAEIVPEDAKTFVKCYMCQKYICRSIKCADWLPKTAEWECELCQTSKESLALTSSWVADQISFNQQKLVYPMRARSEIFIPITECNDSSLHFESVSQIGANSALITAEQKLKIREYVEEIVAKLLGGNLDNIAVNQLSKSENYLPAPKTNGHHPYPNGSIVQQHNDERLSRESTPGPDFTDISEARLRNMIQKIIGETMNMPPLSKQYAVSEIALDRPSKLAENMALTNGHRHRTEHYFEPTIYHDLLATAVLNKIVDKQSNNNRTICEASTNLSCGAVDEEVGAALDQNYNIENQSVTSSSSLEPHSDCSYTDTEPNVTTKSDKSSELLMLAGRDSALSDYLASHMVPLPDLSTIATESEEDDHMSVTSSAIGDGNWENNWLFKKKKSTMGTGSVSTSSVGMLVPDPKEDVRAQIGDKTADEISDLSELGSDTDDSSLDILRGKLDPINDRLFNKHLIGGQNSKMVLDELIDRSSMISNTLPTDLEQAYTETRNEHVDAPSKTEAINANVSQQSNNNNQVDQEDLEVILPPMGFDDNSSNPLAVDEEFPETEGCTGFSNIEVLEPALRSPSVFEILAAIALGPMLAVPAADEPSAITSSELMTLSELRDLALTEIKTRSLEMIPHSLGVIHEELGEFDLKNFPTPDEIDVDENESNKLESVPEIVLEEIEESKEIVGQTSKATVNTLTEASTATSLSLTSADNKEIIENQAVETLTSKLDNQIETEDVLDSNSKPISLETVQGESAESVNLLESSLTTDNATSVAASTSEISNPAEKSEEISKQTVTDVIPEKNPNNSPEAASLKTDNATSIAASTSEISNPTETSEEISAQTVSDVIPEENVSCLEAAVSTLSSNFIEEVIKPSIVECAVEISISAETKIEPATETQSTEVPMIVKDICVENSITSQTLKTLNPANKVEELPSVEPPTIALAITETPTSAEEEISPIEQATLEPDVKTVSDVCVEVSILSEPVQSECTSDFTDESAVISKQEESIKKSIVDSKKSEPIIESMTSDLSTPETKLTSQETEPETVQPGDILESSAVKEIPLIEQETLEPDTESISNVCAEAAILSEPVQSESTSDRTSESKVIFKPEEQSITTTIIDSKTSDPTIESTTTADLSTSDTQIISQEPVEEPETVQTEAVMNPANLLQTAVIGEPLLGQDNKCIISDPICEASAVTPTVEHDPSTEPEIVHPEQTTSVDSLDATCNLKDTAAIDEPILEQYNQSTTISNSITATSDENIEVKETQYKVNCDHDQGAVNESTKDKGTCETQTCCTQNDNLSGICPEIDLILQIVQPPSESFIDDIPELSLIVPPPPVDFSEDMSHCLSISTSIEPPPCHKEESGEVAAVRATPSEQEVVAIPSEEQEVVVFVESLGEETTCEKCTAEEMNAVEPPTIKKELLQSTTVELISMENRAEETGVTIPPPHESYEIPPPLGELTKSAECPSKEPSLVQDIPSDQVDDAATVEVLTSKQSLPEETPTVEPSASKKEVLLSTTVGVIFLESSTDESGVIMPPPPEDYVIPPPIVEATTSAEIATEKPTLVQATSSEKVVDAHTVDGSIAEQSPTEETNTVENLTSEKEVVFLDSVEVISVENHTGVIILPPPEAYVLSPPIEEATTSAEIPSEDPDLVETTLFAQDVDTSTVVESTSEPSPPKDTTTVESSASEKEVILSDIVASTKSPADDAVVLKPPPPENAVTAPPIEEATISAEIESKEPATVETTLSEQEAVTPISGEISSEQDASSEPAIEVIHTVKETMSEESPRVETNVVKPPPLVHPATVEVTSSAQIEDTVERTISEESPTEEATTSVESNREKTVGHDHILSEKEETTPAKIEISSINPEEKCVTEVQQEKAIITPQERAVITPPSIETTTSLENSSEESAFVKLMESASAEMAPPIVEELTIVKSPIEEIEAVEPLPTESLSEETGDIEPEAPKKNDLSQLPVEETSLQIPSEEPDSNCMKILPAISQPIKTDSAVETKTSSPEVNEATDTFKPISETEPHTSAKISQTENLSPIITVSNQITTELFSTHILADSTQENPSQLSNVDSENITVSLTEHNVAENTEEQILQETNVGNGLGSADINLQPADVEAISTSIDSIENKDSNEISTLSNGGVLSTTSEELKELENQMFIPAPNQFCCETPSFTEAAAFSDSEVFITPPSELAEIKDCNTTAKEIFHEISVVGDNKIIFDTTKTIDQDLSANTSGVLSPGIENCSAEVENAIPLPSAEQENMSLAEELAAAMQVTMVKSEIAEKNKSDSSIREPAFYVGKHEVLPSSGDETIPSNIIMPDLENTIQLQEISTSSLAEIRPPTNQESCETIAIPTFERGTQTPEEAKAQSTNIESIMSELAAIQQEISLSNLDKIAHPTLIKTERIPKEQAEKHTQTFKETTTLPSNIESKKPDILLSASEEIMQTTNADPGTVDKTNEPKTTAAELEIFSRALDGKIETAEISEVPEEIKVSTPAASEPEILQSNLDEIPTPTLTENFEVSEKQVDKQAEILQEPVGPTTSVGSTYAVIEPEHLLSSSEDIVHSTNTDLTLIEALPTGPCFKNQPDSSEIPEEIKTTTVPEILSIGLDKIAPPSNVESAITKTLPTAVEHSVDSQNNGSISVISCPEVTLPSPDEKGYPVEPVVTASESNKQSESSEKMQEVIVSSTDIKSSHTDLEQKISQSETLTNAIQPVTAKEVENSKETDEISKSINMDSASAASSTSVPDVSQPDSTEITNIGPTSTLDPPLIIEQAAGIQPIETVSIIEEIDSTSVMAEPKDTANSSEDPVQSPLSDPSDTVTLQTLTEQTESPLIAEETICVSKEISDVATTIPSPTETQTIEAAIYDPDAKKDRIKTKPTEIPLPKSIQDVPIETSVPIPAEIPLTGAMQDKPDEIETPAPIPENIDTSTGTVLEIEKTTQSHKETPLPESTQEHPLEIETPVSIPTETPLPESMQEKPYKIETPTPIPTEIPLSGSITENPDEIETPVPIPAKIPLPESMQKKPDEIGTPVPIPEKSETSTGTVPEIETNTQSPKETPLPELMEENPLGIETPAPIPTETPLPESMQKKPDEIETPAPLPTEIPLSGSMQEKPDEIETSAPIPTENPLPESMLEKSDEIETPAPLPTEIPLSGSMQEKPDEFETPVPIPTVIPLPGSMQEKPDEIETPAPIPEKSETSTGTVPEIQTNTQSPKETPLPELMEENPLEIETPAPIPTETPLPESMQKKPDEIETPAPLPTEIPLSGSMQEKPDEIETSAPIPTENPLPESMLEKSDEIETPAPLPTEIPLSGSMQEKPDEFETPVPIPTVIPLPGSMQEKPDEIETPAPIPENIDTSTGTVLEIETNTQTPQETPFSESIQENTLEIETPVPIPTETPLPASMQEKPDEIETPAPIPAEIPLSGSMKEPDETPAPIPEKLDTSTGIVPESTQEYPLEIETPVSIPTETPLPESMQENPYKIETPAPIPTEIPLSGSIPEKPDEIETPVPIPAKIPLPESMQKKPNEIETPVPIPTGITWPGSMQEKTDEIETPAPIPEKSETSTGTVPEIETNTQSPKETPLHELMEENPLEIETPAPIPTETPLPESMQKKPDEIETPAPLPTEIPLSGSMQEKPDEIETSAPIPTETPMPESMLEKSDEIETPVPLPTKIALSGSMQENPDEFETPVPIPTVIPLPGSMQEKPDEIETPAPIPENIDTSTGTVPEIETNTQTPQETPFSESIQENTLEIETPVPIPTETPLPASMQEKPDEIETPAPIPAEIPLSGSMQEKPDEIETPVPIPAEIPLTESMQKKPDKIQTPATLPTEIPLPGSMQEQPDEIETPVPIITEIPLPGSMQETPHKIETPAAIPENIDTSTDTVHEIEMNTQSPKENLLPESIQENPLEIEIPTETPLPESMQEKPYEIETPPISTEMPLTRSMQEKPDEIEMPVQIPTEKPLPGPMQETPHKIETPAPIPENIDTSTKTVPEIETNNESPKETLLPESIQENPIEIETPVPIPTETPLPESMKKKPDEIETPAPIPAEIPLSESMKEPDETPASIPEKIDTSTDIVPEIEMIETSLPESIQENPLEIEIPKETPLPESMQEKPHQIEKPPPISTEMPLTGSMQEKPDEIETPVSIPTEIPLPGSMQETPHKIETPASIPKNIDTSTDTVYEIETYTQRPKETPLPESIQENPLEIEIPTETSLPEPIQEKPYEIETPPPISTEILLTRSMQEKPDEIEMPVPIPTEKPLPGSMQETPHKIETPAPIPENIDTSTDTVPEIETNNQSPQETLLPESIQENPIEIETPVPIPTESPLPESMQEKPDEIKTPAPIPAEILLSESMKEPDETPAPIPEKIDTSTDIVPEIEMKETSLPESIQENPLEIEIPTVTPLPESMQEKPHEIERPPPISTEIPVTGSMQEKPDEIETPVPIPTEILLPGSIQETLHKIETPAPIPENIDTSIDTVPEIETNNQSPNETPLHETIQENPVVIETHVPIPTEIPLSGSTKEKADEIETPVSIPTEIPLLGSMKEKTDEIETPVPTPTEIPLLGSMQEKPEEIETPAPIPENIDTSTGTVPEIGMNTQSPKETPLHESIQDNPIEIETPVPTSTETPLSDSMQEKENETPAQISTEIPLSGSIPENPDKIKMPIPTPAEIPLIESMLEKPDEIETPVPIPTEISFPGSVQEKPDEIETPVSIPENSDTSTGTVPEIETNTQSPKEAPLPVSIQENPFEIPIATENPLPESMQKNPEEIETPALIPTEIPLSGSMQENPDENETPVPIPAEISLTESMQENTDEIETPVPIHTEIPLPGSMQEKPDEIEIPAPIPENSDTTTGTVPEIETNESIQENPIEIETPEPIPTEIQLHESIQKKPDEIETPAPIPKEIPLYGSMQENSDENETPVPIPKEIQLAESIQEKTDEIERSVLIPTEIPLPGPMQEKPDEIETPAPIPENSDTSTGTFSEIERNTQSAKETPLPESIQEKPLEIETPVPIPTETPLPESIQKKPDEIETPAPIPTIIILSGSMLQKALEIETPVPIPIETTLPESIQKKPDEIETPAPIPTIITSGSMQEIPDETETPVAIHTETPLPESIQKKPDEIETPVPIPTIITLSGSMQETPDEIETPEQIPAEIPLIESMLDNPDEIETPVTIPMPEKPDEIETPAPIPENCDTSADTIPEIKTNTQSPKETPLPESIQENPLEIETPVPIPTESSLPESMQEKPDEIETPAPLPTEIPLTKSMQEKPDEIAIPVQIPTEIPLTESVQEKIIEIETHVPNPTENSLPKSMQEKSYEIDPPRPIPTEIPLPRSMQDKPDEIAPHAQISTNISLPESIQEKPIEIETLVPNPTKIPLPKANPEESLEIETHVLIPTETPLPQSLQEKPDEIAPPAQISTEIPLPKSKPEKSLDIETHVPIPTETPLPQSIQDKPDEIAMPVQISTEMALTESMSLEIGPTGPIPTEITLPNSNPEKRLDIETHVPNPTEIPFPQSMQDEPDEIAMPVLIPTEITLTDAIQEKSFEIEKPGPITEIPLPVSMQEKPDEIPPPAEIPTEIPFTELMQEKPLESDSSGPIPTEIPLSKSKQEKSLEIETHVPIPTETPLPQSMQEKPDEIVMPAQIPTEIPLTESMQEKTLEIEPSGPIPTEIPLLKANPEESLEIETHVLIPTETALPQSVQEKRDEIAPPAQISTENPLAESMQEKTLENEPSEPIPTEISLPKPNPEKRIEIETHLPIPTKTPLESMQEKPLEVHPQSETLLSSKPNESINLIIGSVDSVSVTTQPSKISPELNTSNNSSSSEKNDYVQDIAQESTIKTSTDTPAIHAQITTEISLENLPTPLVYTSFTSESVSTEDLSSPLLTRQCTVVKTEMEMDDCASGSHENPAIFQSLDQLSVTESNSQADEPCQMTSEEEILDTEEKDILVHKSNKKLTRITTCTVANTSTSKNTSKTTNKSTLRDKTRNRNTSSNYIPSTPPSSPIPAPRAMVSKTKKTNPNHKKKHDLLTSAVEISPGTCVRSCSKVAQHAANGPVNTNVIPPQVEVDVVEDEDDDQVASMPHFVPGSIAEREYMKWYNAVDMPNNPYAPEALKRRISGSQERFFDLPKSSPTTEQCPLEVITKEQLENEEADKRESEYRRYSRDYYINDGSKSSQVTSPMPDSNSSNNRDAIEPKQSTEIESKDDSVSNITLATITTTQTEETPIVLDLYKAMPAQVVEDTAGSSSLDTMSQQSLQSATTTTSDDSDTIKIYDFKKQETTKIAREEMQKEVEEKQDELEMTPTEPTATEITPTEPEPIETVPTEPTASAVTKERPMVLNLIPKDSTPSTVTTPTRGSTPPAFKFLQPKRKLLDPSQVLSVEEDEPQVVTGTLEKPVIEKEVAHAMPSVKALARAFLMTSSSVHHSSEKMWPRKFKAIQLVTTKTTKPLKTLDAPAATDGDKSEEDITITSDLSSLETDTSAYKSSEDTKDPQIVDSSATNDPATTTPIATTGKISPVPVRQGVLKSNIAFFENLKKK